MLTNTVMIIKRGCCHALANIVIIIKIECCRVSTNTVIILKRGCCRVFTNSVKIIKETGVVIRMVLCLVFASIAISIAVLF